MPTSDKADDTPIREDLLYARVAGLVFNQPLLVTPDVAETIGNYIRSRMDGTKPDASRFIGREAIDAHSRQWKGYRRTGTIGIVSILGELVNRGAWLGASSGLTSYEGIVEQVRQAAADSDVRDIVLDINSPGGEAYGMSDAARSIRSIAKASGKRVISVINSVGASAAYGLATSGDEIVVTESGIAGSIGVVMVHFDVSDRASKMGVKATVITAGKNKATGHPFAPLDDDARKKLQNKVDRIMAGFVKLVADHRPSLTAAKIRALEADTFVGDDAVQAGLADRVGTFESVVERLTATANGGRGSAPRRSAEAAAATEVTSPPVASSDTVLIAEHEHLVAAAREEGHAAGAVEGSAAARAAGVAEATARISAILDDPAAKGREAFARHVAFKMSIPTDDAIALLMAAPKEEAPRAPTLAERMRNAPSTYTGVPWTPDAGPTSAAADARQRGREMALRAKGKVP